MNIEELRKVLKDKDEINVIVYISNIVNNLEKEIVELKAYNTHLQSTVLDKDKEILILAKVVDKIE